MRLNKFCGKNLSYLVLKPLNCQVVLDTHTSVGSSKVQYYR